MRDASENPPSSENFSLKRIASLDFLRGIAIFVMTFAHCFYHIYDYTWVIENPKRLLDFPKILMGFGLVIAYIGTWNTFFLLISSSVNALGMRKSAAKLSNMNRVLLKKLIAGFSLLAFGYFIQCFGFYGYFGEAIRGRNTWDTSYEIWNSIFTIATIQMIAWGLIITSIINYFLFRKNGHTKFKRNLSIYGFLTIAVLALTPLVHQWIDSMNWLIPESFPAYMDILQKPIWPNEHVQTYNASLKTYILVQLGGYLEPLFPCLATAFAGSMIGLVISQPQPSKKLPRYGTAIGLSSMILGGVLIAIGMPFTIFDQRPSLTSLLIQLGGQVLVVMLFLRLVEYRGKAAQFANNRFVRYIRKWAMISLTVFWLEIYDLLPKLFLNITFGSATGINFLGNSFGYGQLVNTVLVAVFSLLWYDLLIRIWGKFNFIGSFEWFMIRLQSFASKQEMSSRLNVDLMLNKVQWINFVEAVDAKKDEASIPVNP